jgi:LacI family transcriptional regulator
MKKGKPTIHDIARSLEIDSSTVSRALSDSARVSKKTKVRIVEKAKELGYQRNMIASNLRTNKSNTIGVIVPRISRQFFSRVISGIEETAYKGGYDVVIGQSLDTIEREKNLLQTFYSSRVDGVLISISMETTSFEHLEAYKNHGFPIIFFDRPCNVAGCTNVLIDDFKASFDSTEHLINEGCKDIVHFSGPQNLELYRQRAKGYMEALKKYGVEIRDHYIFESNLMQEDGEASAKKLLKLANVDGVFSANDVAAIGAMKYLKSKGIRIPDDIAFAGFSNELISEVIEPSLTTVNQRDVEMGIAATSLLFEQIKNKSGKIQQKEMLDPELIIRNSSKRKSTI